MAVQREDGSWLMDGMMPINEFKSLFRIVPIPQEEENLFNTPVGFVMMWLECIPAVTDHFDRGGFRFQVTDMDERRADKVLVRNTEETKDQEKEKRS